MAKKYYWLKLHKDFFKRHDIKIVESMPNGKDYLLFYLKLLTESIDHEGTLRFNESIPYNDSMLSSITNTNVDTVRSAIKIFAEMGMMDIFDDGTLFMNQVEKMMGSETDWAKKKREYRTPKINESALKDSKKANNEDNVLSMSSQCPNDVLQMSDKSKSIELEIENRDRKEEKINKKEISPFQPYNPEPPKKNVLQQAIEHWNSKEDLPRTVYDCLTIPKLHDILPKFNVYSLEVILKAIDNLDSIYLDIEGMKPTCFHNFFANHSIDIWVDDANPFQRYEKPFNEDNMTKNESRAYTRYYIEKKKYCENWTDLREFMETDYFIDYLKDIEDE